MKTLQTLLDRFRPAARQRARVLPDEQLQAALAALDDHSPQLAALLDQLHGQFETNLRLAFNFHEPPEKRLRALDRAAAVLDAVELIEFNRQEARALRDRTAQNAPQEKAA